MTKTWFSLLSQIESGLIHGPHAKSRSSLHDRRKLVLLAAANELGNSWCADQNFPSHIQGIAADDQPLRKDGLQHHGQAVPDFVLSISP